MTLQRLIIQTHKWLAAGAGLFTFLWFFSGIVMVTPLLRPAARRAGSGAMNFPQGDSAPFRQIAVSIPQAIAAAESAAGQPLSVERVALRTVAGKLVYEIAAAGAGTFLMDVNDASRVVVNEDLARRIAVRQQKEPVAWAPVTLLREHTREYKSGPLPAYRLGANDSDATVYFISAETGEIVNTSTRATRLRLAIAQMHTFEYLRPQMAPRTVNALLASVGAVGLLMSLFGGAILMLQLRNWLLARRRLA